MSDKRGNDRKPLRRKGFQGMGDNYGADRPGKAGAIRSDLYPPVVSTAYQTLGAKNS